MSESYDNARLVSFEHLVAATFLPFLPMLPTQTLLNNFLYDLAQVVTIPTDKVDETFIHKPQRWNVKLIRDFMIYIGPRSPIYDFLTLFALLRLFHASEQFFHSGWLVESLATQTLVIFGFAPPAIRCIAGRVSHRC